MMNRKYLLAEIFILFLITGLILSCKGKPKSSSPYPAVLSVKITPENPKTTNDLNTIMEGLEGKNLTLKYLWKRNGDEILGETFKTLRNINFSKHDTISVMVAPVQGGIIGESVESEPVVIRNSRPVISYAMIQPQPAYTNNQLEVMIEVSDDDDDYIVYSYKWTKNDQDIYSETENVLSSEYFKRGDSIKCTITPSDREVEGNTYKTLPIVITNSPPVITSQPPSDIVLEQFFTYKITADDPDQDQLVFSLSSSSPEGMTIDSETGVIKWKIAKDFTGVYPIEIIISDEHGGRCSQRFNLSVGKITE